MSLRGNHEKAARYTTQLYDARCNGQWQNVPELARKVEKHAPNRILLPLAARAGARIYNHPSTKIYREAEQEYGQKLVAELPARSNYEGEDVLDGAIAVAAISFGIGAYDAALSRSPVTLHEVQAPAVGHGEEGWRAVCVVQGTLIRGVSYEHVGEFVLAAQTYRSTIGYLSHLIELPSQCSELRRWVEELLCHICMFFSTDQSNRPAQLGEAMAGFHLLSKQLDSQGWRPISPNTTFAHHNPLAVWRAYYEALSRIVRDDLVYHPSPGSRASGSEFHGFLGDDDYLDSRIKQRADLKRVEVNYENLLLKETVFPKASESNHEVATWIDLVMSNWKILCGSRWTNEELGAGGKLVVGRSTLDILYRAATKTFHSTQILRHLFTVHAFLGEFDLALKAFDTYVEIMTRGKARTEKSGSAGMDIDDDAMAVEVASEAISMCCCYGTEEVAERALEIGEKLQDWLAKSTTQSDMVALRDSSRSEGEDEEIPQQIALPPEVQYLALSTIGLSQANYARFATSPTLRSELQRKAVDNLTGFDALSINPTTGSLYALGLALAETRDIAGAQAIIKRALHQAEGIEDFQGHDAAGIGNSSTTGTSEQELEKFDRRRKALPIWHLMALLLCAREDYAMAAQCLSAALEQFKSSASLLTAHNVSKHERHQSTLSASPRRSNQRSLSRPLADSPFDRMEAFEKHTVIEMEMTQLALIELTEGPDAAVNAGSELFSLFTRLFGVQDLTNIRPATRVTAIPPKSSSGTVRSIFGRQKQPGSVPSQRPSALPTTTTSAMTSRPGTAATAAPTIQVTAENGTVTEPKPSTDGRVHRRSTLKKKTSESLNERSSTGSKPQTPQHSARTSTRTSARTSARTSMEDLTAFPERTQPSPIPESPQVGSDLTNAHSRGQDLGYMPHNMPVDQQRAPQGRDEQLLTQDSRLPVPPPSVANQHNFHTPAHGLSDSPHPHFHKLAEYKATTSLLIKIWLFTARLYTAGSNYADAHLSIEEANKLAAAIESAVAAEYGPSIKRFQETGWGGGKSVEHLWADVCNERGRLLVAQGQPHEAMPCLERALGHVPDHAEATVALCNVLLDVSAKVIPEQRPDADAIVIPEALPRSEASANGPSGNASPDTAAPNGTATPSSPTSPTTLLGASSAPARPSHTTDTRVLNRTAARDRAYGLLSSLTKLPHGWDDSEAWFALARAYEESGQIEKAKEALWTVVSLEDTRPLRAWKDLGRGGFVL